MASSKYIFHVLMFRILIMLYPEHLNRHTRFCRKILSEDLVSPFDLKGVAWPLISVSVYSRLVSIYHLKIRYQILVPAPLHFLHNLYSSFDDNSASPPCTFMVQRKFESIPFVESSPSVSATFSALRVHYSGSGFLVLCSLENLHPGQSLRSRRSPARLSFMPLTSSLSFLLHLFIAFLSIAALLQPYSSFGKKKGQKGGQPRIRLTTLYSLPHFR